MNSAPCFVKGEMGIPLLCVMYTFLFICLYSILYIQDPSAVSSPSDSTVTIKQQQEQMQVIRVKAQGGKNSPSSFYVIDDKPVDRMTYNKYLLKKQLQEKKTDSPVKPATHE